MHGGPLEVVLRHVGQGLRRGQEVAHVHLPTTVEGVVLEVALDIGIAT